MSARCCGSWQYQQPHSRTFGPAADRSSSRTKQGATPPRAAGTERCPPADNRLAGDTPEIRFHGNRFNCWTDKEQAARQKPASFAAKFVIIRTGTCRNLGSVPTSGFKDALVLS